MAIAATLLKSGHVNVSSCYSADFEDLHSAIPVPLDSSELREISESDQSNLKKQQLKEWHSEVSLPDS